MERQAADGETLQRRSRAWWVLTIVPAGLVLLMLGVGTPIALPAGVPLGMASVALLLAVFATRQGVRDRAAYESELVKRAAAAAAASQRLSVARELHDTISHGLGVITVRAAVARRLAASVPEEPAMAVVDIERVARETTAEIRRMLTVLRSEPSEDLTVQPPPDLESIDSLVARAQEAGISVRVERDQSLRLSRGAACTVMLVVAEALSNVTRHAGPTEVDVSIRRDGDAVIVRVDDAGPDEGWQPVSGTGNGLIGLRERLSAVGGSLVTEDRRSGFTLIATIPDSWSAPDP